MPASRGDPTTRSARFGNALLGLSALVLALSLALFLLAGDVAALVFGAAAAAILGWRLAR